MKDSFLWWRDGVIYQIYPRSFADGNDDGIGDIKGIIAHLDYLVDLGVDSVWLSPIYPSPNVDFGYDVSDYKAISPQHGTMEDFDELLKGMHQRGLHLIMDLVLNHTSDQHPWFKASQQSKDNPYRDWYIWRDPKLEGGVPNNWESIVGGKAWEIDEKTNQYYYHMFYKEQPDVNWRNPAVRQVMLDVFRFWLDKGVDGFRLDVFNLYFKHSDFPDNPHHFGLRGFDRQQHRFDFAQPEMLPLLEEIRRLLDSYPDRYAVGEPFLPTPEKDVCYIGPNFLHAVFNLNFIQCQWKARDFLKVTNRWEHVLPFELQATNVMNNHDEIRAGTRYGRGENDERLKVLAAFLLTIRGTPYLYYGEEIGMRDIPINRQQVLDPVGKRYWPLYKGRDGCRSPMQWDSSAYAGFSTTEPWLPVHTNSRFRNVLHQREDPDSLFNFYRNLLQLRKKYPALRYGLFQLLTYHPVSVLGYIRQTQEQMILVVLNFSRFPKRLALGSSLASSSWRLLLSNCSDSSPEIRSGMLPLKPNEVFIMLKI